MKPKINRLVQQTHIACNNRETEFPWLNNKTTTMCMSLPGIWRKSRKNTDYIALTLSSKFVVLREKRGWLSPVVGVLQGRQNESCCCVCVWVEIETE